MVRTVDALMKKAKESEFYNVNYNLNEPDLSVILLNNDPEQFIPLKCNAFFIVSDDLRITFEEKRDISRLPLIRDTRTGMRLNENTLMGCISKEARDARKTITRRLNSGSIVCAVPMAESGEVKGIIVLFYCELEEDRFIGEVGEITERMLTYIIMKMGREGTTTAGTTRSRLTIEKPSSLEDYEKCAILNAGESAKWNISKMARTLGIGRNTLYYKMKKYGIDS